MHHEPSDQTKIDRLFVAAFLADLRAAHYRRGNRRMNFLSLLAELRLAEPDADVPIRRRCFCPYGCACSNWSTPDCPNGTTAKVSV